MSGNNRKNVLLVTSGNNEKVIINVSSQRGVCLSDGVVSGIKFRLARALPLASPNDLHTTELNPEQHGIML